MEASWVSRLERDARLPGRVVSNSLRTTEATESRMTRPALVEIMSTSSLSSLEGWTNQRTEDRDGDGEREKKKECEIMDE